MWTLMKFYDYFEKACFANLAVIKSKLLNTIFNQNKIDHFLTLKSTCVFLNSNWRILLMPPAPGPLLSISISASCWPGVFFLEFWIEKMPFYSSTDFLISVLSKPSLHLLRETILISSCLLYLFFARSAALVGSELLILWVPKMWCCRI